MTLRQHLAIAVGVTTFVISLVGLYHYTSLNAPQSAIPSTILGLEIGWLIYTPRFWSFVHAYPFARAFTWTFGRYRVGTNQYEPVHGLSWILFVGAILAAGPLVGGTYWLLSQTWLIEGSWYEIGLLMWVGDREVIMDPHISLAVMLGITTFSALVVAVMANERRIPGSEWRMALAGITVIAALVLGALIPLILMGLVAFVATALVVIVGCLLIGSIFLASTNRLTTVTAGILIGSVVSYVIAGTPSELQPFMQAMGIGIFSGWLAGELLHRAGSDTSAGKSG